MVWPPFHGMSEVCRNAFLTTLKFMLVVSAFPQEKTRKMGLVSTVLLKKLFLWRGGWKKKNFHEKEKSPKK